jgi:hypothetical protein
MSVIDTQHLVLVDQASPSSLSSQAVEHSYVGYVRSEASPENLAPNLRLMSQREKRSGTESFPEVFLHNN